MEFTLFLCVVGKPLESLTDTMYLLDNAFIELCSELIKLRIRPVLADFVGFAFEFIEYFISLMTDLLKAFCISLHTGDIFH